MSILRRLTRKQRPRFELSDKIIAEHHLTAMMVTHNMRDAIRHGNRLIMMDSGRIILDISGEEKKRLTVEELLERFPAGFRRRHG